MPFLQSILRGIFDGKEESDARFLDAIRTDRKPRRSKTQGLEPQEEESGEDEHTRDDTGAIDHGILGCLESQCADLRAVHHGEFRSGW